MRPHPLSEKGDREGSAAPYAVKAFKKDEGTASKHFLPSGQKELVPRCSTFHPIYILRLYRVRASCAVSLSGAGWGDTKGELRKTSKKQRGEDLFQTFDPLLAHILLNSFFRNIFHGRYFLSFARKLRRLENFNTVPATAPILAKSVR